MTRPRTRTPLRRAAAPGTLWRSDPMGAFAAVLTVIITTVVVAMVVLGRAYDGDDPSSTGGGFVGGDFHSLVADPAVSGRLFVGGHEAVSVSDDGGVSWQRIDALDSVDAMGWGFNSGRIWISGHPGIVMSLDGGETFGRRSDALPDTDIHALGAASLAGDQRLVYAAGPVVGVIASRDNGVSWQSIATDDGQSFFGKILIDADDPQRLLAADAARGPVASDDGGETWDVLTRLPVSWISTTAGFQSIYASGSDGAAMSGDGGDNWQPLNLPAGASLVEADPQVPGRLYAGVHDGASVTVLISEDQGRNWREA